jgi:leucyl-tRNA synthetase
MSDFKSIQDKWQKKWEDAKLFAVKEDPKKPKYYCLEMFPYPSGSGLHMGHAFNYTIGDIYSRFKRMRGFNVLYPMGYDAFGLPAENAAIKAGEHPASYTQKSVAHFIKQQKGLGLSYDWSRMVTTCTPEYYRWNQYFFLKFLERGLVYRKKAPVNWCPECQTVLANEQVHDGRCWRHSDTEVQIKHLEQWFIKTTDYANELYNMIDGLQWPERIKTMQKNWIGKSHGTEITFKINNKPWPIFTTRPDTIFGVTFVVISAQHSRLMEIVTKEQKKEVEAFLKKIKSTSEKDAENLEKEGAFTGSYAVNPLTDEKIPVYTGNFVVADYGSGMVMAVPAHDQRDFEFAKKYKIPVKVVIQPAKQKLDPASMSSAFTDVGMLVNSCDFNGLKSDEAIGKITKYLESKDLGKRTVQYKLRDWLISRQRYWGTPIPVIYCDKCGIVPVPEKEVPIKLPEKVTFGEGNPLASNKEFVNAECPKCGGSAKRETDTMDTFFDSSWYYLRYCGSKNDKEPFSKDNVKYWMPVDQYIGGAEHACMHLIYARFFTKALRDMGYLKFDEPFTKLFNQGMLHGTDGEKMSKSKGNVILPEEISDKYGIDTARFFLMSIAMPDKDLAWSDQGIEGSLRFIRKVMTYFDEVKIGKSSKKVESKLNKVIKAVTEDIEQFRYNLAIINVRDLFESLEPEVSKDTLEKFIKLLHPFCPHITEELWEKIGNKPYVSTATWPVYDIDKIDPIAEYKETIGSEIIADIRKVLQLIKNESPKKITLIISLKWKYQFYLMFKQLAEQNRDMKFIIGSIMQTELKKYGQDITKLVPVLLKDPSKIPPVVLDQNTEHSAINDAKAQIEKEFNCDIEIMVAEQSKHAKAGLASPGKPAIVIE